MKIIIGMNNWITISRKDSYAQVNNSIDCSSSIWLLE